MAAATSEKNAVQKYKSTDRSSDYGKTNVVSVKLGLGCVIVLPDKTTAALLKMCTDQQQQQSKNFWTQRFKAKRLFFSVGKSGKKWPKPIKPVDIDIFKQYTSYNISLVQTNSWHILYVQQQEQKKKKEDTS